MIEQVRLQTAHRSTAGTAVIGWPEPAMPSSRSLSSQAIWSRRKRRAGGDAAARLCLQSQRILRRYRTGPRLPRLIFSQSERPHISCDGRSGRSTRMQGKPEISPEGSMSRSCPCQSTDRPKRSRRHRGDGVCRHPRRYAARYDTLAQLLAGRSRHRHVEVLKRSRPQGGPGTRLRPPDQESPVCRRRPPGGNRSGKTPARSRYAAASARAEFGGKYRTGNAAPFFRWSDGTRLRM